MSNDDYIIKPKHAWIFGDHVNTDLIVPSEYLTENDPDIIVKHAFEGINPDFSKKVDNGDIIVAGRNFGCGSSREEAVFVIKELGISAVIAESFARIYFRNLINQGIPAITLKNATQIFGNMTKITINISDGIINCIDLNTRKRTTLKFKPLPEFIMKIIEAGGALNLIKTKVKEKI
ncbi:MAG: 3-isopropylmalate dehydratase [Candidatus Lokiarchaeota archaeon]|nr:3-isopropylmalate dehydratase [Candidatus Lokiarchaeota archaeon]